MLTGPAGTDTQQPLLVPRPTVLGFASSPPAKLVLLTVPATSPYPPENHSFHFNVEYFHSHEELPLATMEQRIREACKYIENFPDAKIATVARDFKVPRSTLRDRLNGCHSKKGCPGLNTKLKKEEEIAICCYIGRLDKINLAVRPEFIADAARSIILARSSTKQQSVEPTMGKFWVTRFPKRHGYSKYRQRTINADRQTAEELGIVQKYLEFTAPKQQGHKRLLIVDCHGSQHTLEFVEFCDSRDIIPVGMPPYLNHLLQPLDVAVLQPLKHYQAKALDTIIRDECAHITKLEFLAYIQQIRTQAFKESTVKSAFKKTGIHPFNS
jgi:hypothetical protein